MPVLNLLYDAMRTYGPLGSLRLGLSLVATKCICRHARLIRMPVYIRNRHLIRFGPRFTSGVGLRIEAFGESADGPRIEIGSDVQVNDYVHIGAVQSVRIGNNVLIASKVFVSDHNHGIYSGDDPHDSPDVPPSARSLRSSPVSIEDNVWIGEFVSILPGVTIGRGSVIGSMSVVTKDIPPGCVAAGSPARVLRRYDPRSGRWEEM
jgi:lipopolysaccharide O-acetyltransferase